ncbi:MAG: sucrase ferredoxin [Frankia sp.]
MLAEDRCAATAARRGDAPEGTAITAHRFLLIEQEGGWGQDAITGSRFDPVLGRAIAQAGIPTRTRILMIRRPGRGIGDVPVWLLADTRPGREGIRTGSVGDGASLLDLVREDAPTAGTIWDAPLFCVCTHGRHDSCCAIRGRPLAAALATLEPESTWECSHVGGDRFAANLLILPHGLTYGRVTAEHAADVVDRYRRGLVEPALLRGRSTFGPAVQAAQHHARAALGFEGVDGLAPRGVEQRDGAWTVALADPEGGQLMVTVRKVAAGPPVLLTCDARGPAAPPAWRLEALVREPRRLGALASDVVRAAPSARSH